MLSIITVIVLNLSTYLIHCFHIFFDFPNGSLWSNILASPITWGLGIVLGVNKIISKLEEHHQEKMKQADRHHKTILEILHNHHEEHMETINELRK